MPSGGGGTSKTVSTQELAPEQRELLKGVLPVAKDYLKTPLQQFGPSTIAGPTALQQQGRQSIVNAATGSVGNAATNSINTAQQLMQQGAQGGAGSQQLSNLAAPSAGGLGQVLSEYQKTAGSRDFLSSGALLDPRTNPVLAAQSEAALRPITQNLTERVLPGVRQTSIGGNMFGGSRQGIAEGRAISDYVRQAGDITTNLQANNFNQGLGAMLQSSMGAGQNAVQGIGQGLSAAGQGSGQLINQALQSLAQTPGLAQLAFLPGTAMEAIGESDRQLKERQLQEQAQKFTTGQMLPFMQAQDVANLAFGIGGGTATTTGTQEQPNNWGGMLGGLGSLGMMLKML